MLTRLLPILPLLLCPLLMLVCMWAMRYMGNGETPQGRTRTGAQEMPAAARSPSSNANWQIFAGGCPQPTARAWNRLMPQPTARTTWSHPRPVPPS